MAVSGAIDTLRVTKATRDRRNLAFVLVVLTLSSCIPDPVIEIFEPGDLKPPAVVTWGAIGPAEILVVFDESVRVDPGAFAVAGRLAGQADGEAGLPVDSEYIPVPAAAILSVGEGSTPEAVLVVLEVDQDAGLAYVLTGLVSDSAGNLSSFVLPYWGFNADPARLVINELLTEGSSTRPDALELFVHQAGNLAGLTLFIGSPGLYDLRYVFPACTVAQGEFIILHLKPQALPEELDELDDITVSGGLDASSVARDFWASDEPGSLSGKNGVVVLSVSPTGGIMDAVAYSERTSESDTKYDGFGTAVFRDRVAGIVAYEAWAIQGLKPAPEDCARSTGTTSTRTICRSSQSVDSDSGPDWHIVPTKGISLGTANSDAVYVP
ncbi:MAG: hypothetical protein RBT68_11325 [Spirochaetia bacterium]|jgi:hypothetical protein|nr:hypothetical protein [Spirochaetia bacterium]